MAGELLLELMNQRGGNSNEYTDLVYGTVIDTSPLQIQISQTLILTDDFVTLGEHCTKHKVKMTYNDRTSNNDEKRTETVTIDESLQKGDGVILIRQDGGQEFFALEKIGDDQT